jgi:hypothetical protein
LWRDTLSNEVSEMRRQATPSKVPAGPALVRGGVVSVLGAALGAVACGGRTESGSVPPATDVPTATPKEAGGREGGVGDSGHDATTFSLNVDSGYSFGLYDATGRHAADAIADAASDGYIFEPPCGKKVPPHR